MNPADQMLEAVKTGNLVAVRQLLASDPSLARARDSGGNSAVLMAVYHGRQDVAGLLVERGAALDVFEAAAVGRADRLREILAEQPGLARSYSHDGWTPLHLAAFFGRAEAAEILLANHADLGALARNPNANTPLQAAAASRKRGLVGILIAAGAEVDAKTGYGWTALHLAAHNGDAETARLLIESSADARARNDKGQTPAAVAAEGGHKELAAYLERKEQEK